MTAVMTPAAAHIRQGLRRNSRWRLRRKHSARSPGRDPAVPARLRSACKDVADQAQCKATAVAPSQLARAVETMASQGSPQASEARTHWKTLSCRKPGRPGICGTAEQAAPSRPRQKLAYDRADSGHCANSGPDSGYCADCAYSGPDAGYCADSASHGFADVIEDTGKADLPGCQVHRRLRVRRIRHNRKVDLALDVKLLSDCLARS